MELKLDWNVQLGDQLGGLPPIASHSWSFLLVNLRANATFSCCVSSFLFVTHRRSWASNIPGNNKNLRIRRKLGNSSICWRIEQKEKSRQGKREQELAEQV